MQPRGAAWVVAPGPGRRSLPGWHMMLSISSLSLSPSHVLNLCSLMNGFVMWWLIYDVLNISLSLWCDESTVMCWISPSLWWIDMWCVQSPPPLSVGRPWRGCGRQHWHKATLLFSSSFLCFVKMSTATGRATAIEMPWTSLSTAHCWIKIWQWKPIFVR